MNYANHAAVLADFVLECWQCAKQAGVRVKNEDGTEREISPDEAAIDFIANWIADPDNEQGSLIKLCKAYSLNWGTLHAWIRRDTKRDALYVRAMSDRGLARKERLLDGFWQTATLEVDKPAEHLDVHRARESLAKAEGMFKPDAGNVKGSITITFDDVDARA